MSHTTNSSALERVTVRVPASTSNCGSGFDTLGIALELYNYVSIEHRAGTDVQLADTDPRALEMTRDSAAAFFAAARIPACGFSLSIAGEIPVARGLGSSVTVIAGVIAGLNFLHGSPLRTRDLVSLTTQLEGHPDNASAAILGGFCASRCDPATNEYLETMRCEVDDTLVFVVVSPALETLTKESRDVLPRTISHADAVRSVNAASFLTAAFMARDYEKLRWVRSDFLHEPYRLPKIPGAAAAIEAGLAAGALSGWLSGSGSSVLCVARAAAAPEVAARMQDAFAKVSLFSKAHTLRADNAGLVISPRLA